MASTPFLVSVVSTGFGEHKEWLNFLVSVLNLIATIFIPFLLWWYGKQQGKLQQQRSAQQRLEGHVEQLSNAGGAAMEVIINFKDDCESLGASYVDVFKTRKPVSGPAAAAAITRQQLQEVDLARRRLQGMWDNIMDDYRADLLGGAITDPRHGRMLRRGLGYMELVEPLEAANFARLQAASSRVATLGPYVLPDTAGVTDSDVSTAQQVGTGIMSRSGARPSRFRWLENQRTLQLTGKELWASQTVQEGCGTRQVGVKHYRVDPSAVQALQQGGSAEQHTWQQALAEHWVSLQQACTPLAVPRSAGACPAASGQEVQVLVTQS